MVTINRFLVFLGFLVLGLFSLPQTSNAASVWISGQPSCASGPYSITVNWDVAPDPTWGYFVDITPDSSFGTFWNKQVSGGLRSVSAMSGFGSSQFGESAPSGSVQLNPSTTYYARVWSGTHYPNSSPGVSFSVPACATATPTPAPSQPTISGLPTCSSGAYNATISWMGTPNPSYGFYVDIDDSDPNFGSFYNKNVGSVFSTAVSNFLGLYPSQNQTLTLQPGTTYYTRVFNGQHSQANSFTVPVCPTPTPTPAPTQPNISGSCSGSNYIANISWSGTSNPSYGFYVDVSNNAGFTHPFWNKNVSGSTYSTQIPSGFGIYPSGSNLPPLVLSQGTYYTRVFNGQHSSYREFVVPTCSTPTPTVVPTPTPLPTPTLTPTPTPVPTQTSTPIPTTVPTPTPVPTLTPTPTPTPVPTQTPTPTSTPTPLPTGNHIVVVRAKGTFAGGGYPLMELRVNSTLLKTWTVNGSFQDYIFNIQGDLDKNIQIFFPNDYYSPPNDRNLIVDYISFDGKIIQSEDSLVFSFGNYGPGVGCANGYRGVETLHCQNSFFEYPTFSSGPIVASSPTVGYDFDTTNNEFVLTDKTAMDPFQGKGIWLSNERIKVYRNVHGSNWSPIKPYSFLTANSAYTLDPLSKLMPTNVGSGVVYVNDGSSYWSNNPYQPGISEDKFESRVGLGYAKEGITYKNLETSVTYFVPSYNQSEPVIIQLVNVKNVGPIGKTFKFFSYQDMVPDGTASFDSTTKSLIITGGTNMFLTSTIDMTNYDSSKSSFLGAGADGNPQTVVSGNLGNSLSSSDDVLAGQVDIYLNPGESREFAFVVGVWDSKNPTEKNDLISKYKNINNVKSVLDSTKYFYKTKTDNIPGLSSRTAKLQTQLRILGYSALSTSMFWDPFVDKLTLNQMAIYNETVNARDTAQIALGLMQMDPSLAKRGIESYLESAQFSNGQIPYGLNIFTDGYRSKPDNTPPVIGSNNLGWGSDNVGWLAFAACSYVEKTGDTNWWNTTSLQYRNSTNDTVYNHILKALNYDYTNNIKPNGLLDIQGGDWIDHFGGSDLINGESVYSSALLYNAIQKCLPYMNPADAGLYSQRANNLKLAIENNAYDPTSGRYSRLVTTTGSKIGSSYDNRVFSDMAMIGLTNDFSSQRVKNTVLAAYNNNQGAGNLVYTPSYTTNEESRLGVYSRPNWLFDNKVWARVCALVTVGLKNQGLNNEAEDNFVKCLPDRWTSDKYASLFNYIEIYDPRGDTQIAGAGFKLSEWSFSDAVDDAMIIWSQAQLGNGQLAQADPSSSGTSPWGFAKNIFSNIFSTISSSFGSFKLF